MACRLRLYRDLHDIYDGENPFIIFFTLCFWNNFLDQMLQYEDG